MATEIDAQKAIMEAERIIKENASKGFAWSPGGIDMRYGILDGFIKPALTGAHLPPIVPHASAAGREDYRLYKESRRKKEQE